MVIPSAKVLEAATVTSPPIEESHNPATSSNISPSKTLPWRPSVPLNRSHIVLAWSVVNHLLLKLWPFLVLLTSRGCQARELGFNNAKELWAASSLREVADMAQVWQSEGQWRSLGRRDGKEAFGDHLIQLQRQDTVNLKKYPCESCELGLIWGKMRTMAQKTAPQMALRNCSRREGKGRVYT